MTTRFRLLPVLICLVVARPVSAQDLTITNARIIVANGTVIESGSIVVRARKDRVRGGRRGVVPRGRGGPDDRRQRHDGHAGVDRCA